MTYRFNVNDSELLRYVKLLGDNFGKENIYKIIYLLYFIVYFDK